MPSVSRLARRPVVAFLVVFGWLIWLMPATAAPAEKPKAASAAATRPADEPKFMRLIDNGRKGGRLETAIASYRNKDGAVVHLVSAVHIGEKSYYEGLNKTFASCDAVLYELIKAKDAPAPRPGEGAGASNPIGQLQHFLRDVLNLEFQLDGIDYTKANFVHADLDAETFQKMQKERGESLATLMLQQLLEAMKRPQEGPDGERMLRDLVKVATEPDMERQVKLFLARQMDDIENTAAGLTGMNGSVILTERNKAAMKVLADTLAKGRKNIAIFYGAAHMPDLADRLREMGFAQQGVEYRTAWDLTIRPDQPSAIQTLIREALKLLDE